MVINIDSAAERQCVFLLEFQTLYDSGTKEIFYNKKKAEISKTRFQPEFLRIFYILFKFILRYNI